MSMKTSLEKPCENGEKMDDRGKPSIHDGHRGRLREHYVDVGLKKLSAHNIIELILFYSIPVRDTNETAHRLIQRFGSVNGVLNASLEELQGVAGIGESTALLFKMIQQVGLRYKKEKLLRDELSGIGKIKEYAVKRLTDCEGEDTLLICMDNQNVMINSKLIVKQTGHFCKEDIFKMTRELLEMNVTRVMIAHNHPNGSCLPSRDDLKATMAVAEFFKCADIALADHMIVGCDGRYFSMRENEKRYRCYLDPID